MRRVLYGIVKSERTRIRKSKTQDIIEENIIINRVIRTIIIRKGSKIWGMLVRKGDEKDKWGNNQDATGRACLYGKLPGA